DSVEVVATVVEAGTGLVLRTVGPFRAAVVRPDPAVDELVQRMMGGIAMMFDESLGMQGGLVGQPPTYPAYREYRAGEEHYYAFRWDSAVARFRDALLLDSTFLLPTLRIVGALGNAGRPFAADSVLRTVESRSGRLSPFEIQLVAFDRAGLQGDLA